MTNRTLNKSIFTPSLYSGILDLWFPSLPPTSKSPGSEALARWFAGSKETQQKFDSLCHKKLSPAIKSLDPTNFPINNVSASDIISPFLAEIHDSAGDVADDNGETKTRRALALMILLDQIPRNLYRTKDTLPLVYKHYDTIALSLSRHIVATTTEPRLDKHSSILRSLPWRQWFYMPLEHSEDIVDHQTFAAILAEMEAKNTGDEEVLGSLKITKDYEVRHAKIVERFGRYPHRNAALSREDTPEEKEWLESGGDTFGVGG